MKTNFIKKLIAITTALVAVIGFSAHVAFAGGYSINTAPNDCQTVNIGNYTTGSGINDPCWTLTSVSANVGDVINVAIYYHNNGTADANNVSFKLTDPTNQTISSNGSVSMTGSILVNGQVVDSGTVTATISGGPSKLVFGQVANYNQTSNTNASVSNGQSILSSSGYQFGTLSPGWENQGVIKISFTVQGATPIPPTPQGQAPSVKTTIVSNLDSANGSVTLNGYYDANNADTTTWFQYRVVGSSSWSTTPKVDRGISNAPFSYNLTGLAPGNYEYEAVASNAFGTNYGAIFPFTIQGNTNTCNTCGCPGYPACQQNIYDPSVQTSNATSNGYNSETLFGNLTNTGGSSSVAVSFNWGTSSYNLYNTVNAGTLSSPNNFSQSISGLSPNTTYYYEAVAQNSAGTVQGQVLSFTTSYNNNTNCPSGYYPSGNTCIPIQVSCGYGYVPSGNTCIPIQQNCGYGYYLVGNTCVPNIPIQPPVQQATIPTITTLQAISVGSSVAVLDGYYNSNGCPVNTFFQYGMTQSLGQTTSGVTRTNNSGSMAQSISSLSPNTTYYYKATGTNCVGTNSGQILSFTTGSVTIPNPRPVIVYNTTNLGGNSFINLTITNNEDVVVQGQNTPYVVTWKNISGKVLKNLVLEVNFPNQMAIVNTTQGSVEPKKSSVLVHIDSLDKNESGQMTIIGDITSGVKQGDPVVAQAVMAFQNPTTQATENAIAYDADTFALNGAGLGASIFGIYLPATLGGWLLIILIILIIIIVAHYYFVGRHQNGTMVHYQNVPVPPVPPQNQTAGAPTQDYIVYRPNPTSKQ